MSSFPIIHPTSPNTAATPTPGVTTENSLHTPNATPTITIDTELSTTLENSINSHNFRAEPNNVFWATLKACRLKGAKFLGVGAIPGIIVGLIVGLVGKSIKGHDVAYEQSFENTKKALKTSLNSDYYIRPTIIDPISFTRKIIYPPIQTTKPDITNIQTSIDGKTIKFTIGSGLSGRTICAKISTPIRPDNLKRAIFSAIVKNETSKNKDFEDSYKDSNTDSPGSSGRSTHPGFWFWLWLNMNM